MVSLTLVVPTGHKHYGDTMAKQKLEMFGFVIPTELKAKIRVRARQDGFLSTSEFVRFVLTKEINGGRNETMVSGATA